MSKKNNKNSKEEKDRNELMNGKFQDCSDIDNIIPSNSGIYCIKIKKEYSKLEDFKEEILDRKYIIYIGITTKFLKERLNQELRNRGAGTFFRSIGAMLGYEPKKGSLTNREKKNNYKFEKEDKDKIIGWINKNLAVNWIEKNDGLENLEKKLIQKYIPLVNITHNPAKLELIKKLRKKCCEIANLK